MHPVLFKIPYIDLTINSYGVMVAIGFVLGIFWIMYEAKRLGENSQQALDLVFYVILAGIVGSRIFHVAISAREEFLANPLSFFQIWKGGLMFYGGLISSLAVAWWYMHRHKMPYLKYIDIFAPAVSLGHAVGRIGCFLAGCCYGREMDVVKWFTVIFPVNPNSFAPTGVPLYPTQLMESMGEFLIFAILVLIVRRIKKFDGQIMATYIMLYAILRYAIEFFRGDLARGFIVDPWLSTSQFVSVVMFGVGVIMYVKLWPRRCLK